MSLYCGFCNCVIQGNFNDHKCILNEFASPSYRGDNNDSPDGIRILTVSSRTKSTSCCSSLMSLLATTGEALINAGTNTLQALEEPVTIVGNTINSALEMIRTLLRSRDNVLQPLLVEALPEQDQEFERFSSDDRFIKPGHENCPTCRTGRYNVPFVHENQDILKIKKVRVCQADIDAEHGCAICLSDFKMGGIIGQLNCGHKFDINCIKKWKKNCPLCRRKNC
jgi:hypothetical protein